MFFSVITKNSNWEISNKSLVTFKRYDGVKDEKRGQFANLRGEGEELGKKDGVFLREGWYPNAHYDSPHMILTHPIEVYPITNKWKNFVPTKFWQIFKLSPPIIKGGGGVETMIFLSPPPCTTYSRSLKQANVLFVVPIQNLSNNWPTSIWCT